MAAWKLIPIARRVIDRFGCQALDAVVPALDALAIEADDMTL